MERPDCVGIDRLLDALAVRGRQQPGVPAIIIDAGSAITVDWLDESGAFAGGSILPGVRLMALALHDYTALLPVVTLSRSDPPYPGTSTPAALEIGILAAAVGGIQFLITQMTQRAGVAPDVFLSGGDAALLAPALKQPVQLWPEMTLEGVRLAAEAIP